MTNRQSQEKILVAVIKAPHGIAGAVSAESYSDNPRRFAVGQVLTSETGAQLRIAKASTHKGRLLLVFQGIETRDQAEKLRNVRLYTDMDCVEPLPEGSYYHFQLLGLEVRQHGQVIGRITDILSYTANDVYVMQPQNGKNDVLIPALKAVVQKVDLEQGCMEVLLPEGLWDEN